MTTSSELAQVSADIHDEYFDIEQLDHRADRAELRLPIYAGLWKKHWFGVWSGRLPEPLPHPFCLLVVRNVIDVSIEDDAQTGWYTVNRLECDSDAGLLRIVANIPCEIVVRCRDLDVELLSGDQQ